MGWGCGFLSRAESAPARALMRARGLGGCMCTIVSETMHMACIALLTRTAQGGSDAGRSANPATLQRREGGGGVGGGAGLPKP
jgi:hypothetical protein